MVRRRDGRGPAWANSLFEDNAEFGLGMRLALDAQAAAGASSSSARWLEHGRRGARRRSCEAGAVRDDERHRGPARARRGAARPARGDRATRGPATCEAVADELVPKSVWIVGGDGWAYDIGFGGLDHVLASGRNVNVLVLDTEVYSNTGGQASKATPRGAVAKFAAAGKGTAKKDLGLIATRLRRRLRRPDRDGRQRCRRRSRRSPRPRRTPGRRW